jgi:iron complex outermembrane receptor protein
MSLVSNITDRWRTTFSYTYSDFTFDRFVDADGTDFSGKTIPGTAADLLYAEVGYQDPAGWFGSFDALRVGKQYANNANTVANAPYTLSNMRVGYTYDSGSLVVTPFVAVNNLFDERYNANVRLNAFGGRYFEPAPGRNFYAGVTVRFEY